MGDGRLEGSGCRTGCGYWHYYEAAGQGGLSSGPAWPAGGRRPSAGVRKPAAALGVGGVPGRRPVGGGGVDDLFRIYKQHTTVEARSCSRKTDPSVHPVWLRGTERISALIAVFTLALAV